VLPVAFAKVGPVIGLALVALIALQGTWSTVLLVRLKHRLNSALGSTGEPPVVTFADIGGRAFGPIGARLIDALVLLLQLGVCSVFISLVSANLFALGGGALSYRACLMLVYAGCVGKSLLRDMRALAPLSSAANALMLLACGAALYAACGSFGAGLGATAEQLWPSSVGDIILCASALLYSYEGVALILPIETQFASANPPAERETARSHERFERVLISAMCTLATIFGLVGCACAIGLPAISGGSVTAYLATQYPDSGFYWAVNAAVTVAVLLTYPLQLQPAAGVAESYVLAARASSELPPLSPPPTVVPPMQPVAGAALAHKHEPSRLRMASTLAQAAQAAQPLEAAEPEALSTAVQLAIRIGLTTVCALVVAVLPKLELLIDLLGAMCQAVMAGLPMLLSVQLHRRSLVTVGKAQLVLNSGLALLCAVFAAIGTTDALRHIVHSFGLAM
jgi:amino acid permease